MASTSDPDKALVVTLDAHSPRKRGAGAFNPSWTAISQSCARVPRLQTFFKGHSPVDMVNHDGVEVFHRLFMENQTTFPQLGADTGPSLERRSRKAGPCRPGTKLVAGHPPHGSAGNFRVCHRGMVPLRNGIF
jgi:hypothetical protein